MSKEPDKKRLRLMLENKWWPTEKFVPKAFQKRKLDDTILVDHLMKQIMESKNASTVISQGTAVSGLGGVGKTTTAIWFAQHFQELYDQIIWFDCGEGSLLSSFKDLAEALNINTDISLQLLAKNSFSQFRNFKCLCIFDNAECYQGPQGIREVLPRMENIHCIITSRNTIWGRESGDGKIPQLSLNAFDLEEAVSFLKCNLNDTVCESDEKFENLSDLLGNLPLALQIAVTTVNKKKISLEEYIRRITATPTLINDAFDSYEKTIDKTMQISLDLIKSHESDHSQLAYNILLIFCYIIPNDVELFFFERIENATTYEVDEAFDLLEEYSLVTIKMKHGKQANIHRLLQQVIRYNAKSSERQLLRKILSCKGLPEQHKIVAFAFADTELQKEFPILRSKYTDHPQLQKCLRNGRFAESVKLAFVTSNYLNSFVTLFNYAVCLERCGELENAIKVLLNVYTEMSKNVDRYSFNGIFDNVGLLYLENNYEVSIKETCGLLFFIYVKSDNLFKAYKLAAEQNYLKAFNNLDSVDNFLRYFSNSPTFTDYRITSSYNSIHIEYNHTITGKSLKFQNCSFSEKLPNDLRALALTHVQFVTESGDNLSHSDISESISPNLKQLKLEHGRKTIFTFKEDSILHQMESIELIGPQEIDFSICSWQVNKLMLREMDIPLLSKKSELRITKLILDHVTLDLITLVNLSHAIEEIKLTYTQIIKDKSHASCSELKLGALKPNICLHYVWAIDLKTENVMEPKLFLAELLDFYTINELFLEDQSKGDRNKIVLDLTEISTMQKVHLHQMRATNWETAKCSINQLILENIDLSNVIKTDMKVNKLLLERITIKSTLLFQLCDNSEEVIIDATTIILPTQTAVHTAYVGKKLYANKITLDWVTFTTENGEKIENVIANEIINISHVKELTLNSQSGSKLTLKMNKPEQLNKVSLKNVDLMYFDESDWNVNEMSMSGIPIIKKLRMQISNLTFTTSDIDLSCLPVSLQNIYLGRFCNVICSARLILPKLNVLTLSSDCYTDFKYFTKCTNLIKIEIDTEYITYPSNYSEVDISSVPINLKTMILNDTNRSDKVIIKFTHNRFTQLETIILVDFPFQQLKAILSDFRIETILFNRKNGIGSYDLAVISELFEMQTATSLIKRLIWVRNDHKRFGFNEMSTHILSERIIVLEENEFQEAIKDASQNQSSKILIFVCKYLLIVICEKTKIYMHCLLKNFQKLGAKLWLTQIGEEYTCRYLAKKL